VDETRRSSETVVVDSDDPDIFDAMYREHFPALMRVAFLLTGSPEIAEDAVHDTFLRCRTRLASLDHPRSYLRAAVVNECRSVHRRTVRERQLDLPPDIVLPSELVELQDALARLPWRQRAAIVLRYFTDIPDAEIATVLDCRPATVRSHIRRGIAALKEVLV
jgi:RNA polymerase sigma factor (sigma-70 family)